MVFFLLVVNERVVIIEQCRLVHISFYSVTKEMNVWFEKFMQSMTSVSLLHILDISITFLAFSLIFRLIFFYRKATEADART